MAQVDHLVNATAEEIVGGGAGEHRQNAQKSVHVAGSMTFCVELDFKGDA
jgi:hypothetical protein